MTDTLVDTNILLDVNGPSPWKAWSERKLGEAADDGNLIINQVIYAELAGGYARREDIDDILGRTFRRENIPWDAAFMAGTAFLIYKARGGRRLSPLPDFFVGAHALSCGYRLLTRDRGHYRSYFPKLSVITPESHP